MSAYTVNGLRVATYLNDMRAGDEYTIKLDYGSTVDITGYTFWLTLKADYADTDAQAALQVSTVAGSHPSDDPTHGVAYLQCPSNLTFPITPGKYLYDVQAKAPGAAGVGITTIIPPLEGIGDKITVHPQVTRAIS